MSKPRLRFPNNVPLRVTTIDEDGVPIKLGTGFIVDHREYESFDVSLHTEGPLELGKFLYTAWHVVAGTDFHNPTLKNDYRPAVRLRFEGECIANGKITGIQAIEIPLLDRTGRPRWRQSPNNRDGNFGYLRDAGIVVPYQLDAVRIPLPYEDPYIDAWTCDPSLLVNPRNFADIGDSIYIAGFPHGYSAGGEEFLKPIYLGKKIAASELNNNLSVLLDGPGAKGMSGSPVFSVVDGELRLHGLYRGVVNTGASKPKGTPLYPLGLFAKFYNVVQILASSHAYRFPDTAGPGTPTGYTIGERPIVRTFDQEK